MPSYRRPRSDNARLTFLNSSLIVGQRDANRKEPFISPLTLDQISVLMPKYEAAILEEDSRLAQREKAILKQTVSMETLKKHIRDFWVVLRRRRKRLKQPPSLLMYYKLTLKGISPNPTRNSEWLSIARKLIQGDFNAVKGGYSPMLNPSADEVKAAFQAARSDVVEVKAGDRKYDLAQTATGIIRSEANDLIREIMEELRFNLRHVDRPSQRRVMRSYGARFYSIIKKPKL